MPLPWQRHRARLRAHPHPLRQRRGWRAQPQQLQVRLAELCDVPHEHRQEHHPPAGQPSWDQALGGAAGVSREDPVLGAASPRAGADTSPQKMHPHPMLGPGPKQNPALPCECWVQALRDRKGLCSELRSHLPAVPTAGDICRQKPGMCLRQGSCSVLAFPTAHLQGSGTPDPNGAQAQPLPQPQRLGILPHPPFQGPALPWCPENQTARSCPPLSGRGLQKLTADWLVCMVGAVGGRYPVLSVTLSPHPPVLRLHRRLLVQQLHVRPAQHALLVRQGEHCRRRPCCQPPSLQGCSQQLRGSGQGGQCGEPGSGGEQQVGSQPGPGDEPASLSRAFGAWRQGDHGQPRFPPSAPPEPSIGQCSAWRSMLHPCWLVLTACLSPGWPVAA